MARDNFSQPTKRKLAERAGFCCSYPRCNAVTIGPSSEGDSSTSNTGEAAHIAAASAGKGARRYDYDMSSEQRSSIHNGIWCCNTHAKLIDTDEVTYSVEMLKKWKLLAERRAQIRQAKGSHIENYNQDLVTLGLAPDNVQVIASANINETIGKAVELSWLADICGNEVSYMLRDFLIEHSRNALTHGKANSVDINFHSNSIEIIDDGVEFPICQLITGNSRGGGKALKALRKTRALGHISSRRIDDEKNSIHIPFVVRPSELPAVNPCAIELSQDILFGGELDVTLFNACDRAYIVAPDFTSYSEGPMYKNLLEKLISEQPNTVLILPKVSTNVLTHFQELFPSVGIETW